ncbi:hypothetical protein PENTCL1PPCAC_20634, partial [Pristionchus entomophagus]
GWMTELKSRSCWAATTRFCTVLTACSRPSRPPCPSTSTTRICRQPVLIHTFRSRRSPHLSSIAASPSSPTTRPSHSTA